MAIILIVEDNEMNADMLRRRLIRAGHTVLLGTDGQSGVDLTREHRPDLVLMDMSLPVMDGWTATRSIKGDASLAHIPIMALTAHAIVGEREKALAAGCDEYETKPVQWTRLQGKITSLLAAASKERGSALSGGAEESP